MPTIDKVRAIAQSKKQRGNIRDHYNAEGVHRVGPGLYLRVRKGVGGDLLKVWLHRYSFLKQPQTDSLGSAFEVTVEQACAKLDLALAALNQGHNPRGTPAASETAQRTFEEEAEDYLATRYPQTTVDGKPSPEALKKAGKHINQWFKSLRDTYPVLGKLTVDQIDSEHVAEAMRTVWTKHPTTADRSLGRLQKVFSRAIHKKRRARAHGNPAEREAIEGSLHSNAKLRAAMSKNHPSLPWQDAPGFWIELAEREGLAAYALRLVLFTVKRTGELLPAQWPEFDLDACVWTIPKERMKVARKNDHTVPLSPGAVQVLKELRALNPKGPYLFPGRDDNPYASEDLMLDLVQRMGYGPLTKEEKKNKVKRQTITPHGFRATFMTWVEDKKPREVDLAKAALDHKVKDKVHAAYQRSDLLERRRELMETWCNLVAPPGTTNVVNLRAA